MLLTLHRENEILQSPKLNCFTFNDLKSATRNFHPDCVLGEGGLGTVFKGWIDEKTLVPTKPGTGMAIAVKRLKQQTHHGHCDEWLNYNAKLSDVGLAKDEPDEVNCRVCAREMSIVQNYVYSFGVVLLELMSGRRALDFNRPISVRNLVE
ncbi:hypothetical protein Fmac_014607 [Flemingia macrophylla]|uniref:Protein kinase domain-containing protein n=1 Tax=Flemingia macrophylla TaxID=520843 RepID=A0ABD1MC99_9FABA